VREVLSSVLKGPLRTVHKDSRDFELKGRGQQGLVGRASGGHRPRQVNAVRARPRSNWGLRGQQLGAGGRRRPDGFDKRSVDRRVLAEGRRMDTQRSWLGFGYGAPRRYGTWPSSPGGWPLWARRKTRRRRHQDCLNRQDSAAAIKTSESWQGDVLARESLRHDPVRGRKNEPAQYHVNPGMWRGALAQEGQQSLPARLHDDPVPRPVAG